LGSYSNCTLLPDSTFVDANVNHWDIYSSLIANYGDQYQNGKIIFNQTIESISRKLSVKLQKAEPDKTDVLYSEKTLGGYVVINENHGETDSNLDIELLFNAVINNQQHMNELFAREA